MKTNHSYWLMKVLKFTILFALAGVIMTYAVMLLWNWLLPSLLYVSPITFWEALGILVLAKLLFGFGRGWHGGAPRHYYWKGKMEERLKNMSPEERERFREEWKRRCGRWGHYDWGMEKKKEEESQTGL